MTSKGDPARRPQTVAMRLKTAGSMLKDTVNNWLDDRAMSLAASLAFYAVLSLAPLLIVAVSVAGLVFGEAAV